MKTLAVVHDQELFEGQTMVIQHSLIGVKTPPIPIKDDDMLGDSIDDLLKFLLRLLAVLDISSGRKPANDVSIFVSQRLAAHQKPAILAILSADSRLDFPVSPAAHRLLTYGSHFFDIVRMKSPGLE